VRDVVLRHYEEPSIAKIFQFCYARVEMYKGGPVWHGFFLDCMSKPCHDPFEDERHKVAMTNKNGRSSSSTSLRQSVMALFVFLTGQRHSCIKNVVSILILAELLI
jgi:hypothetical protein